MNMFISWSGQLSKDVATVLQDWFPLVMQAVKPFLSEESISKGSKWSNELSVALDTSHCGIICVTRENMHSPWMTFEAGALSKSLSSHFISPLLVDIPEDALTGPLTQFQDTKMTRDDMWRLISTINSALGAQAIDEPRLIRTYDICWPDLEARINSILAQHRDRVTNLERELPSSRTFRLLPSRGTLVNPADQSRNIAFKVETVNLILSSIAAGISSNTDIDAPRLVFFKAGYEAGHKFGERILEKWELDYPQDTVIDRINRWCDFDSDVGWGRLINNITIDEQECHISGTIRLVDNFQTYKRPSGNCPPDSALMPGYVQGVLEVLCCGMPLEVACNKELCPLTNAFKKECIMEIVLSGGTNG